MINCKNYPLIGALLLILLTSLLTLPVYAAYPSISGPQNNSTTNVTIGLLAKNTAFNVSTITVPAGSNVTLYFDNQDSGVEHNFAVYDSPEAKNVIFDGDEITGPDRIAYNFKAPNMPGAYFFRCDDHPDKMTGQFIVE